jgi:uncharacterized peroxidase-related enzyme
VVVANQHKLSRFPVPERESLPDDMRRTIAEVEEQTGFVPNVYLSLAHRPDEWRAFFAYHEALMEREEGLSKGERELIVVATSAVNDCIYCVVAHGALARIRTKNPILADQVAIDWRKADLSQRERAMLEFAVKLAARPEEVTEEDLEALRQEGFTEDEIWDIGAITAFFGMSNRLAHMSALRPNDQFYLLGRVPRDVYEKLTADH